MLDYLHVVNYRLFKSLQLDTLRRVNLITGKNNTGKTTILEVIRVLESEATPSVVNDILKKRDAFDKILTREEIFSSMFYRNKAIFHLNSLTIENYEGDIFRIDEYTDFEDNKHGIVKTRPSRIGAIALNNDHLKDKVVFVPTSLDFDNTDLWKKIDLSPRKKDVIEILNVIEKRIVDVGLDVESRKPRVLLKNDDHPLPLKNLGEGTNRIFTIALALVNAKNNILLIDEIDLGLHHSVQKKLWEIIFRFSKTLNVQVFATTHSQDCVETFAEVWDKEDNKNEGNYIRLQRNRLDNDVIEPVYYNKNVLLGSVYDNLETR